jgi:hypothetical protein
MKFLLLNQIAKPHPENREFLSLFRLDEDLGENVTNETHALPPPLVKRKTRSPLKDIVENTQSVHDAAPEAILRGLGGHGSRLNPVRMEPRLPNVLAQPSANAGFEKVVASH